MVSGRRVLDKRAGEETTRRITMMMIFCCVLAFNLDFNQSHNSFFLKTKLCYKADCLLNKTKNGFLFIFSIFISRNYFSSHFHHFPFLLLEFDYWILPIKTSSQFKSFHLYQHYALREAKNKGIMPNCQCSIIFFV